MGSPTPTTAHIRSPKQTPAQASDAWYPYYAGYASAFVEDTLAYLNLGSGDLVLDPWNGSGTTTAVCAAAGLTAFGCDLNPALVVVAKARQPAVLETPGVDSLAPCIAATSTGFVPAYPTDDLMTKWFTAPTIAHFRQLDHGIRCHFGIAPDVPRLKPTALSPAACLLYVALFAAIRRFLGPFRSSNPTWIRAARTEADLVAVSSDEAKQAFVSSTEGLLRALRLNAPSSLQASHPAHLLEADSATLPFSDSTFSAVITSPPYCTRIDYVMATLPELAVLGFTHEDVDALRRRMLGRPSYNAITSKPSLASPYAAAVLRSVREHPSKASASYYYPFFCNYVLGLQESLKELHRVTCAQGAILLVVQESRYKELQIDVQRIVSELAASLHRTAFITDFPATRTMASINSKARRYNPKPQARESLVILE